MQRCQGGRVTTYSFDGCRASIVPVIGFGRRAEPSLLKALPPQAPAITPLQARPSPRRRLYRVSLFLHAVRLLRCPWQSAGPGYLSPNSHVLKDGVGDCANQSRKLMELLHPAYARGPL